MSSPTIWERISLLPRLLPIPGVLFYNAVASFFYKAYKGRKLYRIIFESAGRYVTRVATVTQLQWVSGSTLRMYEDWAKKRRISPVVERVGVSDGKKVNLYWIGDRSAEQVLIYIHGGGFMLPISDFMFTFWKLVHDGMKNRQGGRSLSIAVLDYSLHPATFPTQLHELIQVINHCLTSGPSRVPLNIHLAGDSCGANIILQFMSHTLHPVAGLPPSPIPFGTETPSSPIHSAMLISPWSSLDEQTPSQTANNTDALAASTLRRWGKMYVSDIALNPSEYVPYVKIHNAPANWLDGMEKLVQRVLITTGTAECLFDDANLLHERLKRNVKAGLEVKMDVEENGVHDDAIFDIGAGSKRLNAVGERMVEWLMESCRQ
ncbi:alpha/beta-hydrolase [Marasmius fiardii PR-910]|nr:alpha/beta-hydrolase [Marasmius fiardii PR-910]